MPFSDDIIELLDELSKRLFAIKQFRNELVPIAFFCRKANLLALKKNYSNILPLGTVLFICPKNVEVLSCYSIVFGLITGNLSVIRGVEWSEVYQTFLSELLIVETTVKKHYIKNNIVLVNAHEDLKLWAKYADAKVAWGGNQSIIKYNTLTTKVDCKVINFAHRNSLSIIDCKKITDIEKLAIDFYAATYTFNQASCSSPRAIYFINYDEEKINSFWNKLSLCAQNTKLNSSDIIEKLTELYNAIASNPMKVQMYDNWLYVINAQKNFNWTINPVKGVGILYSFLIDSLENFPTDLKQVQTISYYGIERSKIEKMVLEKKLNSVTRIVALSSVLNFGNVVDGVDLISATTRNMSY